jgi:hypothetical protein
VSDVEYDYCFLEIFFNKEDSPFMDVRISKDQQASFCIYGSHAELHLSIAQWKEIYEVATKFVEEEIENEKAFKKW